jgi:hypothetical protein
LSIVGGAFNLAFSSTICEFNLTCALSQKKIKNGENVMQARYSLCSRFPEHSQPCAILIVMMKFDCLFVLFGVQLIVREIEGKNKLWIQLFISPLCAAECSSI